MASVECPESLRQALLDLLTGTLLAIRNKPTDANLCYAHADHMHNVPDSLARFHPDRLAYSGSRSHDTQSGVPKPAEDVLESDLS